MIRRNISPSRHLEANRPAKQSRLGDGGCLISMEVTLVICGHPAGSESQWGVGKQGSGVGGAPFVRADWGPLPLGLLQCFMKQYKRHLQPTSGLQQAHNITNGL